MAQTVNPFTLPDAGFSDLDPSAGGPKFHHVSVFKFLLMSVTTFGLYPIYWMWRCWRWVERRDQLGSWPLARALFGVLWYHSLLRRIEGRLEEVDAEPIRPRPWVLALGFFASQAL